MSDSEEPGEPVDGAAQHAGETSGRGDEDPTFEFVQVEEEQGQADTGPSARMTTAARACTLLQLLRVTVDQNGSELHLAPNTSPLIRVDATLRPIPDTPSLRESDVRTFAEQVLSRDHRRKLDREGVVRTSIKVLRLANFKVTVFQLTNGLAMVFRRVSWEILGFRELGIPEVVAGLAATPHGLVLICGPPANGKSSVEAAIVDRINSQRSIHILSIDENLGVRHSHKKALVNHMQVDWSSSPAELMLAKVVSCNPDVVVVRDLAHPNAMECAVGLARGGLPVIVTIDATSTGAALSRLVASCESLQGPTGLADLASILVGSVCVRLIPKATGRGRCLAMEIVSANRDVRRLIRDGRFYEIASYVHRNVGTAGMQSLTQSVASLYNVRQITLEVAERWCEDPVALERLIRPKVGVPRRLARFVSLWLWSLRRQAVVQRQRTVRHALSTGSGSSPRETPRRAQGIRVNLLWEEIKGPLRRGTLSWFLREISRYWKRRRNGSDKPIETRPWHRQLEPVTPPESSGGDVG